MSDPRIAECVVVDRHSAAEPAIWVALAAESIQLASVATPGSRRRATARSAGGVSRGPSGFLAPGLDGRQETAEVPGTDDGADGAGVVVDWEEFVQRRRSHGHLLAVGPPEARGWQGPR